MCSDLYNEPTVGSYRESAFWDTLSRYTFAAVRDNVVMLHSGHAFVEPPVINNDNVQRKLRYILCNLISSSGLLFKLLEKIHSQLRTCYSIAEYLKATRRCQKSFGRLKELKDFQGIDFTIPSIMEGPSKYNESKVYDSVENFLFIKKYLARDSVTFLEIGAGAGLLSLLLLDQISQSKVIICDLPATIAVGYTLISYFAKEKYKIVLPHEVTKDTLDKGLYDLVYITPNQTHMLDDNSIDGAINVHSMQEMEMKSVRAYFDLIKRVLRKEAIFYCKNFEFSKQYSETKFDDYPWDSVGIPIFDGISEYATNYYGEGSQTMRVKIVKR